MTKRSLGCLSAPAVTMVRSGPMGSHRPHAPNLPGHRQRRGADGHNIEESRANPAATFVNDVAVRAHQIVAHYREIAVGASAAYPIAAPGPRPDIHCDGTNARIRRKTNAAIQPPDL